MSANISALAHIARPYASALFDLATETKSLDEVEKSLDSLLALIDENADFSRFLRSPAFSAEDKVAVVDKLVERAKAPQVVANFLKLVARNKRLFALVPMIAAFKQMAAKARGEMSAEVTSAVALSDAQIKSLAETLKDKMGKTVKLIPRVDPELIGGLVVKVGSRMIDSSIKTKLTAMRLAMKEVG